MTGLIVLSALGGVTILAGLFHLRKWLAPLTILGLLTVAVLNLVDRDSLGQYNYGMLLMDDYAVAFSVLILVSAVLLFMMHQFYFFGDKTNATEFFSVMIFTIVGAQVMVSYHNLIMLFIGIEILSVSLYVMAGSYKSILASNEASLKYFLMGSFATGFLLMGIALIYGSTGELDIERLGAVVSAGVEDKGLFITGLLLLLTGLAFKVAAVPFHFWAPDVYQGSPTLVTAFMATMVKIAAIGAFLRLFYHSFQDAGEEWKQLLTLISVLTMTVGTITALAQKDFKRLLAYSGISHAGFLLIGIISLNEQSAGAIFYYAVAYAMATITAFAIFMLISGRLDKTEITTWNGLSKRSPLLALAMTIALLSLTGIPPLAGFFGKYYLLVQAIGEGRWILTIFAILNSLIGVYYYFYVLLSMYVKEPTDNAPVKIPSGAVFVIALTTIISLAAGLFPEWVLRWV